MVLAAAEDDDPEFAELKHIVAVDEDHYYYVITELDTLGFHAHFHAHEIHPTTSTLAVIQFRPAWTLQVY